MAVVINSGSLFQAGGKQIGNGTKSSRTDNAKRKKNRNFGKQGGNLR